MIRPAYAALAVLVVLLPHSRARSLGGSGLALFAIGRAAAVIGGAAAPASFLLVNAILTAAGIALVASAILWIVIGNPRSETADRTPSSPLGHPALDPILLAGLAIASALPGLLLAGLGLMLGVLAAGRSVLRSGRAAWFAPLVAGGCVLATALFLTLTVLGPMGDRIDGLPAGPFSPASEQLLVLLYGGGSLLLAGLPPLTRAPWRLALVPFAAILLVRIAAPGFAFGLSEWQSLAMLVLAAGFVAAAARHNWPALVAGGGLAALWSGRAEAVLPGSILVLSAWVLDQGECLRHRRGISLAPQWRGVPAVVPLLAAAPALEATLRAQVFLPVAALGAVAVILALSAVRPVR